MESFVRIVLGALLVAHGLVHLLWFVPRDDPRWPFRLDRSWLASDTTAKPVAVALIALVVATSGLLGLAGWGVPGLASIWPALAIGTAIASLAVLVLLWDRQLLWGVAINLAVVVGALWRPGWTDRLG